MQPSVTDWLRDCHHHRFYHKIVIFSSCDVIIITLLSQLCHHCYYYRNNCHFFCLRHVIIMLQSVGSFVWRSLIVIDCLCNGLWKQKWKWIEIDFFFSTHLIVLVKNCERLPSKPVDQVHKRLQRRRLIIEKSIFIYNIEMVDWSEYTFHHSRYHIFGDDWVFRKLFIIRDERWEGRGLLSL